MDSKTTYWHIDKDTVLECDVLDEFPESNELLIDVTDQKTKGRLKKFSGQRRVRAYQVYNYKPANAAIKVGSTGEQIPPNPIPRDDVEMPDGQASSTHGSGITTTPI